MKIFICILLTGLISGSQAQVITNPVAGEVLAFRSEAGTNSSSVVYSTAHDMYYACIAGNMDFPLEGFSSSGAHQWSMPAGADLRGLWMDPDKNRLGATTFDQAIISYLLQADGKPTAVPVLSGTAVGMTDANLVPALDPVKKQLVFFNGKTFTFVKTSNGKPGKTVNPDAAVPLDYLNYNSVAATGVKGYELGILDYGNRKIYLMSRKGTLAATIHLPEDTDPMERFGFSFANKRVWLYDSVARTWTAYRIFQ